ncbi:septal ring lytic transglycosylase RlpA family protein [Granulicoccus phenolivorans]|uniref:septal ring lytic transglycosylase RlpA family protein n=1 Tax=Granulicoccus phenolivorans TaxID=266854 RepID=UPI00041ECA2F|nr:septal ring lytic transglycosylase RlpA family protein [Granulicoccus phenolivorans]
MRKKVIPLAIAGGVLIASGGVLGANAALAKDVQLSVDGVPVQVKTNSGTVGDVLKQRKITVGAKDLVAPSFDQKISDGQSISVRYGRELRLDVDGHKSSTWTTSATVDEALNELSVRDGSEVSASRSTAIPREGMDLTIKTAKQVEIVQNGEAKSYTVLGENVGDGLKNAGIEITDKNVVDPAVTEPLVEGGTITVSTQDVKQTTNETDIDYKTVRKETDSLPKGTEKVQTAGVKGKHIEVWEERFVDGKSVEKKKVSEKTDPQPVDEVVLVGTGKATPTPTPSQSKSSSASSAPSSSSASKSADASQSSGGSSSSSSSSSSKSSSSSNSGSSKSSQSSAAQDTSPAQGASCQASFYYEPQITASGEQFDPSAMTAAHKTLPLGSMVKVTNPATGKTVTVRINDRGPYIGGRCLDLSQAAFAAIGNTGSGVMTVTYQVL